MSGGNIYNVLKCVIDPLQCYNVLSESPSKLIVFMCLMCRHKDTLSHRLFQAEVDLESMQKQRDVYERLLQKKQQQIDNLSMECDVLQLEKKKLAMHLEHAR